jgi:hypothetical protein
MTSPRTAMHPAAARARRATARRPAARNRRPVRRPVAKARRSRRPRGLPGFLRWWPALLISAALVAAAAWGTGKSPATGSCTLPDSSVTLTAEQMANAGTIAEVGRSRGLPERAVVIALATAMQESTLRNLPYGDRDSLGLFQQRPSQGWGTPAQVQDPVYAAGIFYDHLVQVPDWENRELTLVADAVQRSAYPYAYGRWSEFAAELAGFLSSGASSESPCP